MLSISWISLAVCLKVGTLSQMTNVGNEKSSQGARKASKKDSVVMFSTSSTFMFRVVQHEDPEVNFFEGTVRFISHHELSAEIDSS